jgi:hypothetical protein
MFTNQNEYEKRITIPIDRRRWRGAQFEAELLNDVFGADFTPKDIIRDDIDRALTSRDRAAANRRADLLNDLAGEGT